MDISTVKFRNSVQLLIETLPTTGNVEFKQLLVEFINKNVYKEKDIVELLYHLSTHLLDASMTMLIADAFKDYLLLIITFSMNSEKHVDVENFITYQRKCIAMAKLMHLSPDVKRYGIVYFRYRPEPFLQPDITCRTDQSKKQKRIFNGCEIPIDHLTLIKCLYQLLKCDPNYFKDLWNWSRFIAEYTSETQPNLTQLYYNNIIAILTNMQNSQLLELNAEIPDEVKLKFDQEEAQLTQRQHEVLKNAPSLITEQMITVNLNDSMLICIEGVLLPIFNKENSEFYAKTDGAYDKIVKVDSTTVNLRSIALGIAATKAICLSGPVGCGKTTLVEFLARKTGRICPKRNEIAKQNIEIKLEIENQSSENRSVGRKRKHKQKTFNAAQNLNSRDTNGFLRIQLGDQTDSKMLLGQYHCTDMPGEFIWLPGVLTQAVMNGYWLLLEDLDSATQDTYTILSSLLEHNYLNVPGFRDCIKIEPGFQLFITIRTNKSATNSTQKWHTLLEKYLYTINILPLSRSELCKVVSTNYPKLTTISHRIVDVFLTFSSGDHASADNLRQQDANNKADTTEKYVTLPFDQFTLTSTKNSGRLVSTRDLIKLCQRSNSMFSITSTECAYFVFQNAVDVFCSYLPQSKEKTTLIISIGAKLGIIRSRCEHLSNNYKPEVHADSEGIKVGRALLYTKTVTEEENELNYMKLNESKRLKLTRKLANGVITAFKTTFSFTRIATCLLERIGVCITHAEPVLLVGETGVGKTSAVQYLAERTQHKLIVVNMNNQSDISDLIGGFKPVELKYLISPLRTEFEVLFRKTFNPVKNEIFLNKYSIYFNQGKYNPLVHLMIIVCENVFKKPQSEEMCLLSNWKALHIKLIKLKSQMAKSSNISFAFIPGSLVNCIENGDWILLDEINLATAETLECLSTILEPGGSVVLLERGDFTPVKRHPDFRIFACMNPNTDIGKKDLSVGIRNRFTEFFVDELTTDMDLCLLVNDYLKDMGIQKKYVHNIVKLYKQLRQVSEVALTDGLGNKPVYSLRTLCRSLRICTKNYCGSMERNLYESFCLSFLTQLDPESHNIVHLLIKDSLLNNAKSVLNQQLPKLGADYLNFEGYWIQQGSHKVQECGNYILTDCVKKNLKDLARIISIGKLPVLLQGPTSAGKTSLIHYVAKCSGNHCLRINNHEHTDLQEYIGTYVADETGILSFKEGMLVQAMRHGFWIILDELNLASTDILEALNRVLDDNRELFIAETQTVVKAHPNFMLFATQNPPGLYGGRKTLSRAFKNRFIELHFADIPRPELETILEKRCLIPTSYAKKMVSCMSDLQQNRKTTTKNIFTLRDLFRWGNRYTYANKDLLKDNRYDWNQHLIEEGYLVLSSKVRTPIEIEIIEETLYRNFQKRVKLELLFDVKTEIGISPVVGKIINAIRNFKERTDIVWTHNMTRMAVLTAKALQFDEPVLLVGPTGCGKTTVCQLLAEIAGVKLRILNCHMHTEGADFLGGLRPYRGEMNNNKLFEWSDGPLIQAMQEGSYFMADEISLAEDSVLERLNCILEPERTVLLAEKGGITDADMTKLGNEFVIKAKNGFQFLATMNPGGDFGKKELSPALRNRFTEIWCQPSDNKDDLVAIAYNCMMNLPKSTNYPVEPLKIAEYLVDIVLFIRDKNEKFKFSIRDVLAWAKYMLLNKTLSFCEQLIFGLETTFLDALDMLPFETLEQVENLKKIIKAYAVQKAALSFNIQFDIDKLEVKRDNPVFMDNISFGITPFFISINTNCSMQTDDNFYFDAPTTKCNLFRLLSALTLRKSVLLEGPPGVGKTSIIENVAKTIGYQLVRINLCEHTDLADLFGTDLPAEDNALDSQNKVTKQIGSFVWRDGPLLAALKAADTWVLLDELNLAPQSVLEGLNAILDHRGEVYIPELNRSFHLNKETRIFACQNPLKQGGGRKGLPQSFLNRFTKVYLRKLKTEDLSYVVNSKYAAYFEKLREHFIQQLNEDIYDGSDLFDVYKNTQTNITTTARHKLAFDLGERLVQFSEMLDQGVNSLEFGCKGGPFEINLRDILRWCDLLKNPETGYVIKNASACQFYEKNFHRCFNNFLLTLYERMKLVYYQRMRSDADKLFIRNAFSRVFYCDSEDLNNISEDISLYWTDNKLYLNDIVLTLGACQDHMYDTRQNKENVTLLLSSQREVLKQIIETVHMNKPLLLCGPTDAGKTKLIDTLCQIANQFCNMDSIDDSVTGSFQQVDFNRHLEEISSVVESIVKSTIRKTILNALSKDNIEILLNAWNNYNILTKTKINLTRHVAVSEELHLFLNRISALKIVIKKLLNIPMVYQSDFNDILLKQCELLNMLKNHLNAAESLNTGGSFEWVDSKIVESLKFGKYLLLEHVNLCSSAVLDRLNSVFEPNGKLLISEKGVSAKDKGEIVEKAPNFRAFLTIDPKNGELSRAMRNRCIELSLNKDAYNIDDMRAIVYSQGVYEITAIDCILNIHRNICTLTQMHNFTISHLSKFAFLTASYKRIGYEYKRAIYISAMEIYVYPTNVDLMGYGLSYYQNKLRDVVLTHTEQFVLKLNGQEDINLANVIINCNELNASSMIKLQLEPFKLLLKSKVVPQQQLAALFNGFECLNLNKLSADKLKLYVLYMFYEVSSITDINLRHLYIKELLVEEPELLSLAAKFHKAITQTHFKFSAAMLPWNSLLFPRLRDYECRNQKIEELALSATLLAQLLLEQVPTKQFEKLHQLDVLTYSQAVNNKTIADRFKNEFLTNISTFLKELENNLHDFLSKSNLTLTNYSNIITAFLWFNRFLKYSQQKLFKSKEINNDLVDKLVLHFKWLDKQLLQLVSSISSNYQQLNIVYEESLKKIHNYIKSIKQPLNLIRKIYAKYLTQFQPFYQEKQIQIYTIIQQMDHLLNVVPTYGSFDRNTIYKNIIAQKSDNVKQLRALLQQFDVAYDYKFKEMKLNKVSDTIISLAAQQSIQEFITEIQAQSEEINFEALDLATIKYKFCDLQQHMNMESELQVQQKPTIIELGLLSLREYFLVKLLSKQSEIPHINTFYCEELHTLSNSNGQLIKQLNSNKHKLFNNAWTNITKCIKNVNNPEDFKQLINYLGSGYKYFRTYERLVRKAINTYQLDNLSTRAKTLSPDILEVDSIYEYEGPALTNAITTLIFQQNGSLKPVPLCELDKWRSSLQQIRQIMWHNSTLITPTYQVYRNNQNQASLNAQLLLYEVEYSQNLCANIENDDFNDYNAGFQQLIQNLRQSYKELSTLQISNANNYQHVQYYTAIINTVIGAIELCLLTFMPLIDPVEKNRLKNKYLIEDVECLQHLTTVYDFMKIIMKYKHFGNDIYVVLKDQLQKLDAQQQTLTQKVALRPGECLYRSLVQDVIHFLRTNCEPLIMHKLIESVQNVWLNFTNKSTPANADELKNCTETVNEIKLWMSNSQHFMNHSLKFYTEYYQDFLKPINCAVLQTRFGLENLGVILKQLSSAGNIKTITKLQHVLTNIVEFPTVQHLSIFNADVYSLLETMPHSEHNYFSLIKAKLTELYNCIIVASTIDDNTFKQYDTTLKICNETWQKEEERRRKQQAQAESLYVNKTRCVTEDEELIELQEIEAAFPTYGEEDFGEFIVDATLEKVMKLNKKQNLNAKLEQIINNEDYTFLVENFISVMIGYTDTYYHKPKRNDKMLEMIAPYQMRLQVFVKLYAHYKQCLNEHLDAAVYNSLNFAVGLQQQLLNDINFAQQCPNYDFYKHSNISEIIDCTDVLTRIEERVIEQLANYPEHEGLIDISRVIERIRNLPTTAPVVRFNTGFQLLRQKLSQWNMVAHKTNHLRDEESEVAQFVQRWTKLELQHWRNCLTQVYQSVQAQAHRYWFFIFSLLQQFLKNKQILDSSYTDIKYAEKRFLKEELINANDSAKKVKVEAIDVIRILRQFVEASCFGDFHVRLQLLKAFQMYLQNVKKYSDYCVDELIAGMHNLHIYFTQFATEIIDSNQSRRAPIEKKLKELVKIESYNKDLSYFSMRNNVARVHRNLNKFLKEYRLALQEKITSIFQPKDGTVKDYNFDTKDKDLRCDTRTKYYMLETKYFIAPENLLNKYVSTNLTALMGDNELLQKVDKYFNTARNIVRETVTNAKYPKLITAMDMLLVTQLEHCEHLRKLSVDRTKERAKQVLEAKQILQQKRRALSDLFKTLTKLGINYKAGLLQDSLNELELENNTLSPFCIRTMLGSFEDKYLSSYFVHLSENLNLYYAKCIFKIKLLRNIMLTPLSELGPPNIQRIKGFAIDMFLFVQNQRKVLVTTIECMYNLRTLLQHFTEVAQISSKTTDESKLNFNENEVIFKKLKDSFCRIRYTMQQIRLHLNCAPVQENKVNCLLTENDNRLYQNSIYYKAIIESCDVIEKLTKNTWADMLKQNSEFLQAEKMANFKLIHVQIITEIKKIVTMLETANDEHLPIALPIIELIAYSEHIIPNIVVHNVYDVKYEDDNLSNIVHSVLLSLQKLYKKHIKLSQSEKENKIANQPELAEDVYELHDQHLKSGLYDELNNDWCLLTMADITAQLQHILNVIKNGSTTCSKKLSYLRKVTSFLPILEQYYRLAYFILLQQLGTHKLSIKMLSIILTVFVEIGTKGFCVPPDLMQDEEGQTKNEQRQGDKFGLEDGTGETDASDKIESEDQLDDARRPEDHKNDDDNKSEQPDCKEEKGIEMSDDFDGKMQDIEKPDTEEYDSSKSEDEEDLSKEMGKTEEGANTLDDQIWGSDEEEEKNQDEQDMSEEEQGKGNKDEKDDHNDLNSKNEASKKDRKDDHANDGLDATNQPNENDKRNQEQKDIDNMNESELDEEQVNTYHNELEEPPEPEEMDLGDMNNVDEGNDNDNDEHQSDENPFDIDTMKENMQMQEEIDDSEDKQNDTNTNNESEVNNDVTDSEEEEKLLVEEEQKDTNESEDINEEENKNENNDEVAETQTHSDDDKINEKNLEGTEENHMEKLEELTQSKDKSSKEDNVQSVANIELNSSADQVQNQKKDNDIKQEQKLDEQNTGEDKNGVGQAENDNNDVGHQGIAETKETIAEDQLKCQRQTEEKRKQGHTNEERTLGEAEKPKLKQLKTIDKLRDESEKDAIDNETPEEADEYQHVKEPKNNDKITLDNATEEQSKKIQHQEDEERLEDEMETANVDELTAEEEQIETKDVDDEVEQLNVEKYDKKSDKKIDKPSKSEKSNERIETEEKMQIEGEIIQTMTVPRGTDTIAHCNNEIVLDKSSQAEDLTWTDPIELRQSYQQQLAAPKVALPQHEDYDIWQQISNRMTQSARELCEQLRLILEPTKCTRLKGDYRTGRRINMKKIIPYIASQFRKDKIWLRRTKPAQRDYKITIAIDDSKSMHYNNSKMLTLEAISLVSQALTLLESGRLSIMSFGEAPQIILNHTEQFDGPKLINALNFAQNKTQIAELLDFVRTVNSEESGLGSDNGFFENLLLILSDGRNIFSEGIKQVKRAVRMARLQRIFLVYIIIDNPDNKDSVLDIKHVEINSDQSISIKSYLDVFPFPFYVIVRDLNQLPIVLSEAMRQWFELVNSEQ